MQGTVETAPDLRSSGKVIWYGQLRARLRAYKSCYYKPEVQQNHIFFLFSEAG